MDEPELPAIHRALCERELAIILRAWFDAIVDGLPLDALLLLREQCLCAERSAANDEIVAMIDRRLAVLRAFPPP